MSSFFMFKLLILLLGEPGLSQGSHTWWTRSLALPPDLGPVLYVAFEGQTVS
jgi:hypothetical protein